MAVQSPPSLVVPIDTDWSLVPVGHSYEATVTSLDPSPYPHPSVLITMKHPRHTYDIIAREASAEDLAILQSRPPEEHPNLDMFMLSNNKLLVYLNFGWIYFDDPREQWWKG